MHLNYFIKREKIFPKRSFSLESLKKIPALEMNVKSLLRKDRNILMEAAIERERKIWTRKNGFNVRKKIAAVSLTIKYFCMKMRK